MASSTMQRDASTSHHIGGLQSAIVVRQSLCLIPPSLGVIVGHSFEAAVSLATTTE